MNLWRKLVLSGAVAATVSMVNAAAAHAYDTVDYGTNQAACQAAAKQLKAAGIRYTNCHETGPGHYSLAWDD
ncbi:hypothetical protein BH10ACT9_BH10ACT9_58230 [soil metagenome]